MKQLCLLSVLFLILSCKTKPKETKQHEFEGIIRMSFNGMDLSEAYYLSNKNMEYTLRKSIDTLFYGDCAVKDDELKEVEEVQKWGYYPRIALQSDYGDW